MKKILFSALMCAMISFIGCDKLKEANSVDIKVNNVKFNFEALTKNVSAAPAGDSSSPALRAGGTTSFSVERTVDITEIGSTELAEYLNKINKVKANNSLLKVTAVPSGNYTVTNLTVTVTGITESLTIPSYTLGGTFTAPANMNTFTNSFLMKLVAGPVKVKVEGQTDAPAGTTVYVVYECDLVFTANVI